MHGYSLQLIVVYCFWANHGYVFFWFFSSLKMRVAFAFVDFSFFDRVMLSAAYPCEKINVLDG